MAFTLASVIDESNHKGRKNGFFCYWFITSNSFFFLKKLSSYLLSQDCSILTVVFVPSGVPMALQQLCLNLLYMLSQSK